MYAPVGVCVEELEVRLISRLQLGSPRQRLVQAARAHSTRACCVLGPGGCTSQRRTSNSCVCIDKQREPLLIYVPERRLARIVPAFPALNVPVKKDPQDQALRRGATPPHDREVQHTGRTRRACRCLGETRGRAFGRRRDTGSREPGVLLS